MSEKSFKLCLTMAGAVSAGAYTAGVLDELFHVLDLWEQEKQKNAALGTDHPDYDHSIPMHEVSLEVMSGASAGGIAAALSLQKILDASYEAMEDNKILKECWVTMADDDHSGTLEKLLNSSDLKCRQTPSSLLNGKPINDLANRHFKPLKNVKRPSWVSEQAELLLTTTNLDGLQIDIGFNGADKKDQGHAMTQHSSVFRFKLGEQNNTKENPAEADYYTIDLTRETAIDYLKNAALSTSAFPIGLPSKKAELPHKPYLKFDAYLKGEETLNWKVEWPRTFDSIDGGLLNNEPYGWGVKILGENCKTELKENRYAVIMIDPLPSSKPKTKDPSISGIFKTAMAMFKALRNEVMMNQEGIVQAIALKDRTRFLIAPKKSTDNLKLDAKNNYVLASAPLSGFAGFIEKKRRAHDYELGRKNCRDFLRFHLCLPLEMVAERLGIDPNDAMMLRFGINPDKEQPVAENPFFPIIPDIRLRKACKNDTLPQFTNANEYLDHPEFDPKKFREDYGKLLNKRLNRLAGGVIKNIFLYLLFIVLGKRKVKKVIYDTINIELDSQHTAPDE
ncbi:hypothetical protein E7Z59_02945 [Robertkochia marina]|uniref:PNPLA domain-containing protein n=1 Tax=Robertkochia marina TaxID=1227945 RepID=A0A4S3M339_9FLAO|nr:patatin-like phospholipase family protein [Robertkochia marina]THD69300.1 hypothetical protein E7Z59_02945 [Robertkochia marina]TRZ47441.1 hypothetical protein D3A96_01645 [Robertkochia marina]